MRGIDKEYVGILNAKSNGLILYATYFDNLQYLKQRISYRLITKRIKVGL